MLTGWIYVNYLFHIYRSISLPGGDWTEPDFPTPDGLNDFPEKPQLILGHTSVDWTVWVYPLHTASMEASMPLLKF